MYCRELHVFSSLRGCATKLNMFIYSISTADVASGAIPKQRKLMDRSRRPKDKDGKIEQEEDSSLLKETRLLVQTKEGDVDHRKYVTKSIPQEPNKESCKKYGSQSNAKETFDRDWHFPSLSVKSKNQTKPKISARQCGEFIQM